MAIALSLDTLNPQQREAVLSTEGPLLVVAGAGSGKTRVLTHRIAHLIGEQLASPSEILAITFTNRAATEMKERVQQLVGGRIAARMWVMTFHTACGRMLRRDAELIGYRSTFTIYDQADQVRLVKSCIEDLGKDPKRFVPRAVHGAISRAKDRLLTAELYAEQVGGFFEETVASVYDLYERRLSAANAMDFDDLIMKTVLLLQRVPGGARALAAGVPLRDGRRVPGHQPRPVPAGLDPGGASTGNLAVVGDQDQSIYAFRGADIRNILEFEQDFPDAVVIALEQNYRSTQTILDAANGVIEHNRDRKPKRLWSDLGCRRPGGVVEAEDEHAEARYVAGAHPDGAGRGRSPADIAVFYRMNAQSRVLEDLLTRQGVDYRVVGGPKFYERAEVKDLIAYLQAARQPGRRGVAAADHQPAPARHRQHLARPAERAMPAAGRDAVGGDCDVERAPLGTPPRRAWPRFRELIESCATAAGRPPVGDLMERVLTAHRLRGDAGGRAHDRVAGPDGEPAASWWGWPASSTSAASRSRSRRSCRRSCRRSRCTPTRTRSTTTAAG